LLFSSAVSGRQQRTTLPSPLAGFLRFDKGEAGQPRKRRRQFLPSIGRKDEIGYGDQPLENMMDVLELPPTT